MRAVARLGGMRARAASLYFDTFTVYSHNGTSVDLDGFEVPVFADHGTTPGKIAGATGLDTTARTVTVGGVERPVVEGGLHIPLDSPVPVMGDYGIGWEYVLTVLGPYTDASLLNSRWLVVDSPAKSLATARRLDVVRLV